LLQQQRAACSSVVNQGERFYSGNRRPREPGGSRFGGFLNMKRNRHELPEICDAYDVARYLGVPVNSVIPLADRHQLPPYSPGENCLTWRAADLLEWERRGKLPIRFGHR
jgi:hypothetical protein